MEALLQFGFAIKTPLILPKRGEIHRKTWAMQPFHANSNHNYHIQFGNSEKSSNFVTQ